MSRNALAAGSSLLEENQVSRNALAAGSSLQTSPFALQTSSSSSPTRLLIPIEEVPLALVSQPKILDRGEYDDSLPEPYQATWAKLSITMYRTDGGIVDAELIRPRSWIKSAGIEAGKLLPMNIEELQVRGSALVTAIDDCPEIAPDVGWALSPTGLDESLGDGRVENPTYRRKTSRVFVRQNSCSLSFCVSCAFSWLANAT